MFYPLLDRLVAKGRITIEDDRIMSRAEFEAKQREALQRERRLRLLYWRTQYLGWRHITGLSSLQKSLQSNCAILM